MERRFPVGAEIIPGEGVHFRVWAPRRRSVEVLGEEESWPLAEEGDGYFAGLARGAWEGMRYRFRLDGGDAFPDPASRFQPEGPHGPSEVIDASGFEWSDAAWRGPHLHGLVISEVHIGTFTEAGTWEAAQQQLPELAAVGINAVEVMPVADFPGRFNWGYDGVGLFAPVAVYGRPDDFRRFVDAAHGQGIAVILDVVYNHLGPDGNYLDRYSEDYFTDRYENEWGRAINYDGANSGPVRELISTNAAVWAAEFHMDGLRLDATQQIFDASPVHILDELTESMRRAAGERRVLLMAENERQHAVLARPHEEGGYGLDAIWNDDFHHSIHVAATGHSDAYYNDFRGTPQELISAVKYGFLYQGQRSSWQMKRRGTSSRDLPPASFVAFIDNHDHIANAGGKRLQELTSPGRFRAVTALLLLGPWTPLLFQGQEFAASSPFHFFADHRGELRKLVSEGRYQFLAQFPSVATREMRACYPDPGEASTFESAKLDFTERTTHAASCRLHRDLIKLRRSEPAFRAQRKGAIDGAVLADEALVLRYFEPEGGDRLLLINLGPDLQLHAPAEPLLAAPDQQLWQMQWSSEDPMYGGSGCTVETATEWRIPAHAAIVMRPAAGNEEWRI